MNEREVVVIGGSRIGRVSGAAREAAILRYTASQVVQRETPEQIARRERAEWNKDVDARKRAKKARRG